SPRWPRRPWDRMKPSKRRSFASWASSRTVRPPALPWPTGRGRSGGSPVRYSTSTRSRGAVSQHWQALPPKEQARFVTLFGDVLERSYIAQIEARGGERITFVGESIEGNAATVRSKVVTRRGTEIRLDYRLHVRDGRWQI